MMRGSGEKPLMRFHSNDPNTLTFGWLKKITEESVIVYMKEKKTMFLCLLGYITAHPTQPGMIIFFV